MISDQVLSNYELTVQVHAMRALVFDLMVYASYGGAARDLLLAQVFGIDRAAKEQVTALAEDNCMRDWRLSRAELLKRARESEAVAAAMASNAPATKPFNMPKVTTSPQLVVEQKLQAEIERLKQVLKERHCSLDELVSQNTNLQAEMVAVRKELIDAATENRTLKAASNKKRSPAKKKVKRA